MATLAPISVISIVIGFVSFAFTLAIWLHAFWDAFLTVGDAPSQVRDSLSTLRQGLYEEREYLRRKKRRESGSSPLSSKVHPTQGLFYSGGPTKVLSQALKDLITQFKAYEGPFIIVPPNHRGREKELEWSFDVSQMQYRCDLGHRLLWPRYKNGVQSIAVKLNWIQTRRIAVEVSESHFLLADTMSMVREGGNRLRAIEERLQMSRVGWDEIG